MSGANEIIHQSVRLKIMAVLNALRTTAEISLSPFALPTAVQWRNFASAWRNAALGSSLLHSTEVAGLAIVMVCATPIMRLQKSSLV